MSVAFKPEDATDALKEFVGQIVDVDYAEEPFGFKGAPDIQRRGKVLCVKVRTEAYEKDQMEWYPPSKVKKTKWLYLIEALTDNGAIKDVSTAGQTDDERINAFAKSLMGMVFRFEERQVESLVQEDGKFKKFSLLLPVEYLGKKPIEEVGQVRQASIAETASTEAVAEAAPKGVD